MDEKRDKAVQPLTSALWATRPIFAYSCDKAMVSESLKLICLEAQK